jgi:hypothetical protein
VTNLKLTSRNSRLKKIAKIVKNAKKMQKLKCLPWLDRHPTKPLSVPRDS